MNDFLRRNRFPITVVALLLLPLVLMYYHGRRGGGSSLPERVSIGVAGVAQSGVSWVVDGIAGVFHDYLVLVDVQADNERLKGENERLIGEAVLAKQLAVENQALRRLVDLKTTRKDLRLAPATIIARDMTPFFRVSRLSLQLPDVSPAVDMSVITPAGLVGRIVHASGPYGDVMLLTDSRSRVAAEVLGKGVLGMVVGSGKPDEYLARLQVSLTEKPLEAGAVVVTSGHDRVFPRGIEVGYVADPERRRQVGPFMEYDVALAVNPVGVDDVMVVLDTVRAEPPAGRGSR
jgi:rod shape-determining protein MreC